MVMQGTGGSPGSWRSPSWAIEDRNINQYRANIGHPRGWRSPFGTTEDRNGYGLWLLILTGVGWR
ncbi:hypothetical protein [Streptomyces sp. NPDC101234]|uniref:hypothetical protein n=1 Tax=Streptomyces sp. NPDC101234 TaxID=3366138 RepID=UPI0037F63D6C